MSAYTTLTFTRTAGENYVRQEISNLDNSELERLLDILLDKRLYNARIVSDETEQVDYSHKIVI